MYILQISFWILAYYYEEIEHAEQIELAQTKRSGNHLLFFSNQLIIEFINTLHCNIQLMHTLNYFSFDRNSTTPLEHKFGSVRRRSKFVHTLNKFLRIISQMQSDKRVSKLIDGEKYEKEIEKIHLAF